MKYDFDFLIIGGGISGLTYALEVAEHGNVGVLFKKSTTESSTAYAQGGIAAVQDNEEDSFDLHIKDTITAGAGLVDEEIAELVVKEGPIRVAELIERGANFDKDENNRLYSLHKEGGHSARRILHNADATGWEIQKTLLESCKKHSNIKFLSNYSAIDLITSKKLNPNSTTANKVMGVYVLNDDNEVITITANKYLMSTGGAGKVYLYTSNPDVASGDGIAMCYRAGLPIANMEFFQFHPTCLYHPQAKSFLITEAMRGEGAKLIRKNGERFMDSYHPKAELAPRDIVARAIDHEMKLHGEDCVFLDIRHRGADFIKEKFPNIHKNCLNFGIDITAEVIPVVPAAHYCCGGVATNVFGQTEIENLYVAGETAHTGLHGANRLASNSLLEGMVFAYRAAQHSIENFHSETIPDNLPEWNIGTAVDSNEAVIITQNWDEIRRFMWNYVGIVRSDRRLERALQRSDLINREIKNYYWNFTITSDLLELRNLALVANLVIRSAIARKESRGLHYNVDHSDKSDDFIVDTVLQLEN